jgi:hypothetical protein
LPNAQGETATIQLNADGTQSLQIMLPGTSAPVLFTSQAPTTAAAPTTSSIETFMNYLGTSGQATTFYGPNGETATVITGDQGREAIKVTTAQGTYVYYDQNSNDSIPGHAYYVGSTGTPILPEQPGIYTATGPAGNTAYYAQGPAGNTVAGTTAGYGDTYYSTLPPGIPQSQIPPGQEDLYILKSEVVPPVCPPPTVVKVAGEPDASKCPPCPACARCPEPSFTCKKVPNYDALNNDYLPMPMLNDFSQF